jgi:Nuf2 family
MMDLVSPNFGRTHKILSAIVNFGRFSEERLPFVDRLQQEYTRASEERDELQQEILDLRQKLTDHACVVLYGLISYSQLEFCDRSQLKADEPICVQLAVENQGLTAKLRDLYEEQNAGFQEAEALKVERDKLVLRKVTIVFMLTYVRLMITFERRESKMRSMLHWIQIHVRKHALCSRQKGSNALSPQWPTTRWKNAGMS